MKTNLEIFLRSPKNNCNLYCPYCWMWDHSLTKPPVDMETWAKGLTELSNKFNPIYFDVMSQGEPTLDGHEFLTILGSIAQNNWIALCSNLSTPMSVWQPFKKSPLLLQISYHPSYWKINNDDGLNEFCNRVNTLKNDYCVFISYITIVAYPAYLERLQHISNTIYEKTGITTLITQFIGEYENQKYPDSYTETDLAMMNYNHYMKEDVSLKHSLGRPELYNYDKGYQSYTGRTYQMKCSAGRTMLFITETGDILPCLSSKEKAIGHISDIENFKLLDQSVTCDSACCICRDYQRHLVDSPFCS